MCDRASGEIKGTLWMRQGPGTAREGRGNEASRRGERRGWRDWDQRVKKQ